jgi:hypothetical protein
MSAGGSPIPRLVKSLLSKYYLHIKRNSQYERCHCEAFSLAPPARAGVFLAEAIS